MSTATVKAAASTLIAAALVAAAHLARQSNRWSHGDVVMAEARLEAEVALCAADLHYYTANVTHPPTPSLPWRWWVASTTEYPADGVVRGVTIASGWCSSQVHAESASVHAMDAWRMELVADMNAETP